MISPLGIILLVVAIYMVVKSPGKLKTFGRMAIAFAVSVLLSLVPPLILGIGFVPGWMHIGSLVGVLMAVIVGQWERRSLARARSAAAGPPTPKD